MTKFTGILTGNGQGSDDGLTVHVTSQGELQLILHENHAGQIHGTYNYHATQTVSGDFLPRFVDSVAGYGTVHGDGPNLILTDTDPSGVISTGTATIHGGTINYAGDWSVHDGAFSASGEVSATLTGHRLTPDSTETVGSFAAASHGGTITTSVEPSLSLTHLDATDFHGHF